MPADGPVHTVTALAPPFTSRRRRASPRGHPPVISCDLVRSRAISCDLILKGIHPLEQCRHRPLDILGRHVHLERLTASWKVGGRLVEGWWKVEGSWKVRVTSTSRLTASPTSLVGRITLDCENTSRASIRSHEITRDHTGTRAEHRSGRSESTKRDGHNHIKYHVHLCVCVYSIYI